MALFKGAATALVTPFTENDEIDYASFADIIEYQIGEGIDALVVCGTTGESATLTIRERKELIAFAVSVADGRVPVIAGTGSNSTYRTRTPQMPERTDFSSSHPTTTRRREADLSSITKRWRKPCLFR